MLTNLRGKPYKWVITISFFFFFRYIQKNLRNWRLPFSEFKAKILWGKKKKSKTEQGCMLFQQPCTFSIQSQTNLGGWRRVYIKKQNWMQPSATWNVFQWPNTRAWVNIVAIRNHKSEEEECRWPPPRMFLVTVCWDRCTRSAWERTNKGKQLSQTVLVFFWICFSLSNTRLSLPPSTHPLTVFSRGYKGRKEKVRRPFFLFPELLIEIL